MLDAQFQKKLLFSFFFFKGEGEEEKKKVRLNISGWRLGEVL